MSEEGVNTYSLAFAWLMCEKVGMNDADVYQDIHRNGSKNGLNKWKRSFRSD